MGIKQQCPIIYIAIIILYIIMYIERIHVRELCYRHMHIIHTRIIATIAQSGSSSTSLASQTFTKGKGIWSTDFTVYSTQLGLLTVQL